MYQSTVFKPLNMTPSRTEYELHHASECQTLRETKSQAKWAFGKEILRRNNYMKIDTIGSRKHAYLDTSRQRFLEGVEWITYGSFLLVHIKMEMSGLGKLLASPTCKP